MTYLYHSVVTSAQCFENVNVGPKLPTNRVGSGPRTLFRFQNEWFLLIQIYESVRTPSKSTIRNISGKQSTLLWNEWSESIATDFYSTFIIGSKWNFFFQFWLKGANKLNQCSVWIHILYQNQFIEWFDNQTWTFFKITFLNIKIFLHVLNEVQELRISYSVCSMIIVLIWNSNNRSTRRNLWHL